MRHHAPRTARSQNIENSINNFSNPDFSGTTTSFGLRNQRFENFPLLVIEIALDQVFS